MPFKRIKKPNRGPPKSTLDIIVGQDVIASHIDAKCSTGDILMYANNMNESPALFNKIIQGTGGTTTIERRMPMIHIGCIIKNPPKEILDHYGLEPDPDGFTSYVFEGVQAGCIMMHLKPWIKKQYNPETAGGQVFWRKKLAPIQMTPPDELWRFLKVATSIPYANKPYMSEFWQGLFFMWVLEPSSFSILITIIIKIIKESLQDSLGPGPVRGAAAHMASWVGGLIVFNLFVMTAVIFGIPLLTGILSTKLADFLCMSSTTPYTKGYGVHKDGSLKFMVCSVVTGAAVQSMGLYDVDGPHPSLFLPKDYLPQGVGGDANLFDMALKRGVKYSDNLIRIANPFGPPPKRSYSPSMFVATGQATRNLRNALAMTRDTMAFDVNEFQRGLASGNKQVQKSRLLGRSRLVTKSVFEGKPIIEEDEDEEEENKKDD